MCLQCDCDSQFNSQVLSFQHSWRVEQTDNAMTQSAQWVMDAPRDSTSTQGTLSKWLNAQPVKPNCLLGCLKMSHQGKIIPIQCFYERDFRIPSDQERQFSLMKKLLEPLGSEFVVMQLGIFNCPKCLKRPAHTLQPVQFWERLQSILIHFPTIFRAFYAIITIFFFSFWRLECMLWSWLDWRAAIRATCLYLAGLMYSRSLIWLRCTNTGNCRLLTIDTPYDGIEEDAKIRVH